MKIITGVVALLFAGLAQAVTIDFEELASGTTTVFVSQGFEFNGGGFGGGAAYITGTSDKVLTAEAYTDSAFSPPATSAIEMTRADDGAFALFSLDASFFADFSQICGFFAGGGATCDQATIGTGDWLNIVRLRLFAETPADMSNGFPMSSSITVDNISVGAPVPVPAAVWLFVSALGLIGWLRRS
ncbi:MAG: hypothetical protein HKN56_08235 [Gammaproteobacteria bacterium]|nr:hypothetical protein [Gammaproteobacteria bacterium]